MLVGLQVESDQNKRWRPSKGAEIKLGLDMKRVFLDGRGGLLETVLEVPVVLHER